MFRVKRSKKILPINGNSMISHRTGRKLTPKKRLKGGFGRSKFPNKSHDCFSRSVHRKHTGLSSVNHPQLATDAHEAFCSKNTKVGQTELFFQFLSSKLPRMLSRVYKVPLLEACCALFSASTQDYFVEFNCWFQIMSS